MHNCCSSVTSNNAKCPLDGHEGLPVSIETIIHHLKKPWQWQAKNQHYYFCNDPECNVVYFGEDGTMLTQHQLRTSIGCKDQSSNALLCYCFGVPKNDAITNPAIKDYVIEQTKKGWCSCKTSNPSGRCCLKDFSNINSSKR